MAEVNELVWVAVPNGLKAPTSGVAPSLAVIRVLMVPRLKGGDISNFDLHIWPERLLEAAEFEAIRIRTRVGDGEIGDPVPATLVSVVNADAFRGIFGGAAGQINDFVARTPPALNVRPTYSRATKAHSTYRDVVCEVATPSTPGSVVDPDEVIRRQLHHHGWEEDVPDPAPLVSVGKPLFTQPDFHATVSMLREHPRVLLELGLIFELTVPIAALMVGGAGDDRQLSVECEEDGLQPPFLVSPWTRYSLNPARRIFRPAAASPSASGLRDGLLDLADSQTLTSLTGEPDPTAWAIATFDVDGAADGMRGIAKELAADDTATAVLPTMRSVGLKLLRPNRSADFGARVRNGAANAARTLTNSVLSAEDLVLGYRVDIRRGDAQWRSVCQRMSQYRVDDIPIAVTPSADGTPASADGFTLEEGHVKPFAAVKDANGDLHADDTVLGWDGWNLAVPRPNLVDGTSGASRKPGARDQIPYEFDFEYRVSPEKLPALRFANSYRMRIRVADMAGGGVPFEDDDRSDDMASAPVTYRRHEPVLPPTVLVDGDLATGATVDRIVIRSDRGLTPQQLHALDSHYPEADRRTIVPPVASLRLIEQHGVLDDMTAEDSFELARRALLAEDAGSGLPDWVVSGVNPTLHDLAGVEPATSARDPWWNAGVQWPDPAAKHIEVASANPGGRPIDFKWVDEVGAATPTRTLKVFLAQARQAMIELSSTLIEDVEDHLATHDYFKAEPGLAEVRVGHTLEGRNPVVTPFRRVLVVHAVRSPLTDPRWDTPLVVERRASCRVAEVKPTFRCVLGDDLAANPDTPGLNVDSTGRLTVSASWTEFQDVERDEASPGEDAIRVENLYSEPVPTALPDPEPGTARRLYRMRFLHDFGDTKHRNVTYTVKATTRFRDYFKADDPEDAFQRIVPQPVVNILSTARPPDPVVIGVVPVFTWTRTQPDVNRIEHVRRAQALRIELARPWYVTGEGEQLAVVLAPDDAGATADGTLTTTIGRDPLFATPATGPRPRADWFTATATSVKLPELDGRQVTLIPVIPKPMGDRWCADVAFTVPPAAQSYHPFVRLAVARFQRDSVAGQQISRVVVTDMVPLLPDRHVVVTRAGNQVSVAVGGVSPNPPNRLDAILETCPAGLDPEQVDMVVDDAAVQPGLPAWRPVPGQTVTRTDAGVIPPLTLSPGPGRLRIRLRETERLDGTATTPVDLTRRNVFVDTIVLPAAWHQG